MLVYDNLNIHVPASLYKAFPPEEAMRILRRIEIHHTPVYGSSSEHRRDRAERDDEAVPQETDPVEIGELAFQGAAWEKERNRRRDKVDWQFWTKDARVKLKSLYPVLD